MPARRSSLPSAPAAATAAVDRTVELFAGCGLGTAHARAMFGGHGVYLDGLFVAIVADGEPWLKADATSAPRFAEAGGEPFVYRTAAKALTMGFWRVPDAALDDADAFAPWARLALDAALRARAAVLSRPPRRARSAPATAAGRAAAARTRRGPAARRSRPRRPR